jgi:hypothetical protein
MWYVLQRPFYPPAYFMHCCFLPLFDATDVCVWTSREQMLPITTPDPWVVAITWVCLDFLRGRKTPTLIRLKSRYIRTYVHTYIRTIKHTDLHTYMRTHIYTYGRTYKHAYINVYIHTWIHTFIHTFIRTYVHTYIHSYARTYIHVHPYSLNNYWNCSPPKLSSVIIWEESRMQRFESRFVTLFNFTRDKKVLKIICSHFYILCCHFKLWLFGLYSYFSLSASFSYVGTVYSLQFTFSSARLITIKTWLFKEEEEQTSLFKRPRSHRALNTFHLVYKNQSVMLYGVEVAVYSQMNTKHINTMWAESIIIEC